MTTGQTVREHTVTPQASDLCALLQRHACGSQLRQASA